MRDQSATPRHPVRRGQLGIADAWRLGHRLAGDARRHRDLAVHLLPAGGRHRPVADQRRDHLRDRAHRDVPAEGGQRLRPRLGWRQRSTARCATAKKWSSRSTRSTREPASTARRSRRSIAASSTPITTLPSRCSTAASILPALEHCLKCSHLFNLLDSSGSVGVTERTAYILRVRQLAVAICKAYVGENKRMPSQRGQAIRSRVIRPDAKSASRQRTDYRAQWTVNF